MYELLYKIYILQLYNYTVSAILNSCGFQFCLAVCFKMSLGISKHGCKINLNSGQKLFLLVYENYILNIQVCCRYRYNNINMYRLIIIHNVVVVVGKCNLLCKLIALHVPSVHSTMYRPV